MYYVIERRYAGFDVIDHHDDDYIVISTAPAYTTSGRECLEGFCGGFADMTTYAHGSFATLEEARAKVKEIYGEEVRVENEFDDEDDENEVVESYKKGSMEPISLDFALSLVAGSSIRSYYSDDDLHFVVQDIEHELNREDMTAAPWHERMLEEAIRLREVAKEREEYFNFTMDDDTEQEQKSGRRLKL